MIAIGIATWIVVAFLVWTLILAASTPPPPPGPPPC